MSGGIHHKTGILFPTTILVISIIELAGSYVLSYNQGLKNSFLPVAAIPCCVFEPLKLFILIVVIARLAYPKQDIICKQYLVSALLSILIFVFSWALPMTVWHPGSGFLKGYEKWVERNVDVDGIQTWLLSEETEKYLGQRFSIGSLDPLPQLVTHFEPKHIAFYGDDYEKGRCVVFEWGGALAHWGFVVGLPAMKAKQKGRFHKGSSEVESRHPIKPGVYVYLSG